MVVLKPSCFREWGLTLIEVLVALAIVAIAMTAVIKTASHNIRSTHHLQNKSMALWVGQLVVNEARVGVLPFSDQAFKEKITLLDRDWYVNAQKENTANKRIEKIAVEVYEKETSSDESPLIHLESYIYHDEVA